MQLLTSKNFPNAVFVACILAIYALVIIVRLQGRRPDMVSVTAFDIGQGDAIFAQLPGGKTVLIDGGPDANVIMDLNEKFPFGFCKLDLVLLTHLHKDHYAGLTDVLKKCSVDRFVSGSLFAGDTIELGLATLTVLWPPKGYIDKNPNNLSLVLFLDCGDFEALFTGDAEAEVLTKINLQPVLAKTDGVFDLYKVPHHGSVDGFSPEFVSKLSPAISVISAGENNVYGHPSPKVVTALDVFGDVYITARAGSVSIDKTCGME
ncbi:MAG: Beta-lactamase domain protein [candidate division WWE3 bacterium GW2011_GWA1_46_21]|uniref:Beta-lactamase domain protein n=4 Tax=Katanobacteria TaxID=422282 RepID=A0A0G1RKY7_UNCKA|nr:MAG: Beta-lactamase domain protein [candidate division WWE3 bacterium GW2011_GWA1_46_21]KKU48720.1 MAG: Beta-lactamase domain protein [candidate division WWE3 bacterium GW2011_GWA2_46_9]KKU50983.1 MAG: Beta-lactamase domain protein [candidate division WWE3 bacterium GW2011_GWC1_47_10]KKU57176.1 MAG: Beta-lactamase domain protein [candidate division WWE3 bacterium GW2011_GWB1_47_11]